MKNRLPKRGIAVFIAIVIATACVPNISAVLSKREMESYNIPGGVYMTLAEEEPDFEKLIPGYTVVRYELVKAVSRDSNDLTMYAQAAGYDEIIQIQETQSTVRYVFHVWFADETNEMLLDIEKNLQDKPGVLGAIAHPYPSATGPTGPTYSTVPEETICVPVIAPEQRGEYKDKCEKSPVRYGTFTPPEQTLAVSGKYENKFVDYLLGTVSQVVFDDMVWAYGKIPYTYYDNFYDYFSADNDTAIPNWTLAYGYLDGMEMTVMYYDNFGEYQVESGAPHSPYGIGFFVYVPSEERFYTLSEAWDLQFEGIDTAFTEYMLKNAWTHTTRIDSVALPSELTVPTDLIEPVTIAPTMPTINPAPMPEYTSFRFGDSNMDGTVNIKDATVIQKHIASIAILSTEQIIRADVNGDNEVNIKDASMIQRQTAAIV